jgi:hypothetical protein
MFLLVLVMLGHPWLTHWLVYNTPGKIESNFIPSLFVTCVIFLFGYSCQFFGCFLVYCYVYNIDLWYAGIHVFYIKGTDSHIFIEHDGL